MQRHRGLPRARASLHDGQTPGRPADDPILVGLDGADDVRHPARARCFQHGEQRAFADEVQLAPVERGPVDDLVVEADELSISPAEVPSPAHAHRLAGPSAVEGGGRRRSPVDDHRLALLVGEGEAADVERAVLLPRQIAVDATDAETIRREVERGRPVGRVGHGDVASEQRVGLQLSGVGAGAGVGGHEHGSIAERHDAGVGGIDEPPLAPEFVVQLRHRHLDLRRLRVNDRAPSPAEKQPLTREYVCMVTSWNR